jgi:hypothetical protein
MIQRVCLLATTGRKKKDYIWINFDLDIMISESRARTLHHRKRRKKP